MSAWVYFYSAGGGCYVVGFYSPDGEWHPESDHATGDAAAARVNYLNGGTGK
jgi:hypothetical protein